MESFLLSYMRGAASFALALADAGLKSVVVLALASLVAICMRRSSAAAKHFVWVLSFACLLLVPLLSGALPEWHALPRWTALSPAFSSWNHVEMVVGDSANRAQAILERSPPAANISPSSMLNSAPVGVGLPEASLKAAETMQIENSKADSMAAVVRGSHDYLREALIIWMAGVILCMLPVMAGLFSLLRLELMTSRERHLECMELLEELCRELRLRRKVTLLQTPSRRMPMTWGFFHAKILLPIEFDAWCHDRRRSVLLHELAHIKRHDFATHLLSQAVCALYWFNPLAWLAARQMIAERERACDDIVLRHGAAATDYAEQILEIAARLPMERFARSGGMAMARASTLEGRLRAILDGRQNRATLSRRAAFAGCLLLAILVIPVAMMKEALAESIPSAFAAPSLRFHFSPRPEWKTNEVTLAGLLALPETVVMRNLFFQRLSDAIPAYLGKGSNTVQFIRPLLDDFGRFESSAIFSDAPGAGITFCIALDATRAGVWQTNLDSVFGGSAPPRDSKQWEVSYKRDGNRLYVSAAMRAADVKNGWADLDKEMAKPMTDPHLLNLDVDFAWVSHHWPMLSLNLDHGHFEIQRQLDEKIGLGGSDLRITGQLSAPASVHWRAAPIVIPTNMIQDPIRSFMVVNGVKPFVKRLGPESIQTWFGSVLTNAIYSWSMDTPFQLFALVSGDQAPKMLQDFGPQVVAAANPGLDAMKGGQLVATNKSRVRWDGLPILTPYLQGILADGTPMVIAGLFAFERGTNGFPESLRQRISSRTNLVYYDWEITQDRANSWMLMSQMIPIFGTTSKPHKALPDRSLIELDSRWIAALAPKLGNSITEISAAKNNQFEFVRRSPVGLTGFELVELARVLSNLEPLPTPAKR